RKVDLTGTISTYAGNGIQGFTGDGGPATEAEIGNPRGLLFIDNQLLISSGGQQHVRKVDLTTNIINTFAGTGIGYDGEGNPALSARFDQGTGMFLTRAGAVLIGDQANGRTRTITGASVTTLAGSFGRDNVTATQGVLIAPENIAFDPAGNYYVVEV